MDSGEPHFALLGSKSRSRARGRVWVWASQINVTLACALRDIHGGVMWGIMDVENAMRKFFRNIGDGYCLLWVCLIVDRLGSVGAVQCSVRESCMMLVRRLIRVKHAWLWVTC